MFKEEWDSWWSVDMAHLLQDKLTNNLSESIHAKLHRFCPKGFPIGSLDWKNRNELTATLENEGWVILVTIFLLICTTSCIFPFVFSFHSDLRWKISKVFIRLCIYIKPNADLGVHER